jgi:hypothetical protein
LKNSLPLVKPGVSGAGASRKAFPGRIDVTCTRPASGTCHQLLLERFAKQGKSLPGSDSHAPNAGVIGKRRMEILGTLREDCGAAAERQHAPDSSGADFA